MDFPLITLFPLCKTYFLKYNYKEKKKKEVREVLMQPDTAYIKEMFV